MSETIKIKTAVLFGFAIQLVYFTHWISTETTKVDLAIKQTKIDVSRALAEIAENELRVRALEKGPCGNR